MHRKSKIIVLSFRIIRLINYYQAVLTDIRHFAVIIQYLNITRKEIDIFYNCLLFYKPKNISVLYFCFLNFTLTKRLRNFLYSLPVYYEDISIMHDWLYCACPFVHLFSRQTPNTSITELPRKRHVVCKLEQSHNSRRCPEFNRCRTVWWL